MSRSTSPLRTAAALVTGLALTLTACGGDDTDDTADDTSADAPPMQPAAVTAEAQESDGESVTVASVELPAPGFIAVHGDGGGSPGPVIGHSDLLDAGTSNDVEIELDEPLTTDTTLYPMAHIDTDGNGVYEFGLSEGLDGPALTAAGGVAVVPVDVTVAGGAGPGADDEPARPETADATADAAADPSGAAEITIADFAFTGATEVPVGTTVTVTNTDGTPHTWSEIGGAFDSGSIGPDESFEFTFTDPGTFEYFCNFHPSMEGTITVTG